VQFTPYPAWYFLDLFGLLNLVPGDFEIVGALIIPGVATLILILLPWIDRSTTRLVGSRKFIMWLLGVSLLIIWGLTLWSQLSIMAKQAAMTPAAQTQAVEQTNITKSGGGRVGEQAGPPSATAAVSPQAKHGQQVYSQNCSSCHGAAGAGMANVAPPLAGNGFVTGDPKQVITTVLNGKTGPITVNGQNYNGQMPPWKATLKDKDIADVVTYIRSALGSNSAGAVKPADVAKLRK
jgi:mono/diheme cytochrome c family protein